MQCVATATLSTAITSPRPLRLASCPTWATTSAYQPPSPARARCDLRSSAAVIWDGSLSTAITSPRPLRRGNVCACMRVRADYQPPSPARARCDTTPRQKCGSADAYQPPSPARARCDKAVYGGTDAGVPYQPPSPARARCDGVDDVFEKSPEQLSTAITSPRPLRLRYFVVAPIGSQDDGVFSRSSKIKFHLKLIFAW